MKIIINICSVSIVNHFLSLKEESNIITQLKIEFSKTIDSIIILVLIILHPCRIQDNKKGSISTTNSFLYLLLLYQHSNYQLLQIIMLMLKLQMLQITGSRNTTFFIALVFDMNVILLVLILYRCRLLTSTIWWWLIYYTQF